MTETFISEDPVNCPCVKYNIEQVKTRNEYNALLPKGDYNGFDITIDDEGLLKVSNYMTYSYFEIWLSCSNVDGVTSGMRKDFNVWLEYKKPWVPPIIYEEPEDEPEPEPVIKEPYNYTRKNLAP